MENRCVCCGATIPEGRQVCHCCENMSDSVILTRDEYEYLCACELDYKEAKQDTVKEFVKWFEYYIGNCTFTLGQVNDIQYALKKATEEVEGKYYERKAN